MNYVNSLGVPPDDFTPFLADFAGPYIAFHGAAHGFQLDGEHKDSNGIVTKGTGGFTTPVAGLELGYNIPLGTSFFVDIGARWVNSDGEVNADDVENASDVTLASGDHYTVTISPNVTLNDNSSVFLKLGYSEMDIDATGDITNASTALEGAHIAIGTTSLFDNGFFVRSEAGYHIYDAVSFSGLSSETGSGSTFSVDPEAAYGAVSVGFKF